VGKVAKGIVSTPKTARSIRRVPLFDVLKPYIQDQIDQARLDKSANSKRVSPRVVTMMVTSQNNR